MTCAVARIRGHCRPAMTKADLIETVRKELQGSLDRLHRAASEARAAATDPGSKAESKYDTRSLEASYLASGQARQAQELGESLRILDSWHPLDFAPDAAIEAGAFVRVKIGGETSCFFLVPTAGGLEVVHDGEEVTLLSPASSLYQKLTGLRAGDSLDAPPMTVSTVS